MTDDFEMNQEYFDSDDFLQEPFMLACAAEMNRDKTLVMNPSRMARVAKAYKLIEDIIAAEDLEATVRVSISSITRKNIGISVRADSLSGRTRQEVDKFRDVLALCDGYLVMPGEDNVMLNLTFRNVMVEVKTN